MFKRVSFIKRTAALFLLLSAGHVSATPYAEFDLSVSGLKVILAAGASQCDDSCMTSYDSCVSKGLAAQVVADDEVVYEECSAKLSSCRNVCINQGDCVMDDTGVMICP